MRFAWIPLLATAAFAQQVTLTTSANPSNFGQYVTLTATVGGGATGRVTFYDSVTELGIGALVGGQAILKAPFLLPGAHPLHARYDGDSTHAAASSAVFSQTVSPSAAYGFAIAAGANLGSQYAVQADFNGDGITDLASAYEGASGSGTSVNITYFSARVMVLLAIQ